MLRTLSFALVVGLLWHGIQSSPILNATDFVITDSRAKSQTDPPYLRPTWIDINLDIVHSNVRLLKRHIGEKVHLMAVVKANAYGYGMLDIARTSLASGATWIGVATLDEALVLRRQLSTDIPILVMGYVPIQHLPIASRSRVTVTGISREWVDEAVRSVQQPLDFHLKVDTGMNRLGCRTVAEVEAVIKSVAGNGNMRFTGIFTHFASSEDVNNRTYFHRQLARFDEFLAVIPNRTEKLVHCANSGATLYHAEKPFFDMVRCGKALTGPPNEALKHLLPVPLQTSISVHSALSLVKKVEAGEKIGYSGEYTTQEAEWIGTVPMGYGDGWHQNFRATGVLVDGQRVPIVGRISMDQMMVALNQSYPVGTRVTFVGQQGNETITGDDVARLAKVPRSEVFSSLSSRVPRVYKQENKQNGAISTVRRSWHVASYLLGLTLYLRSCIS